jgi:hypothetical protein
MDPAMQQFLEVQTQLLQNLTNTVTNLQAQVNNPPVQQSAPRNKHREFMSHHPPVFTHAANPLEAEDWLKTVLKMLTTCQCDDREKVLYAAGRLQGFASLGGTRILLLMPPRHYHLGRVYHQLQEPPHTFWSYEDQEGVPLFQAGGNVNG